MYSNNELPVRICHNDTKANNVLFSKETHKPLVVIDLDTIMPGTGMNDFADAARFICSSSLEDECNLSKVYFDSNKFRAFCSGFIPKIKDSWTKFELENLVLATFSITIELASRFLDDYICGNRYFKIDYDDHNLVRARCQIKLAQSIEENFDELTEIVKEFI